MSVILFSVIAESASLNIAAQIIGGIAFSYLDANFIMPGIFGAGKVSSRGPRIEDLSVQGTQEGTPSKFVLGTASKVSGQVIWATDLTETTTTTSGGGGGGKGGASAPVSENTTYSMSVGVRICDTEDLPNGRISRLLKVWANGKLIYDFLAIDPSTGEPTTNEEDRVDSRYDSIAIYRGDQSSTDPTIDASMNIGFWGSTDEIQNSSVDTSPTPMYKGSAYVVINDIQLLDFGNRLPNFEFLVEAVNEQTNPALPPFHTYGDAITRVCLRAGMPQTDFDVSQIPVPVDPLDLSVFGIQSTGDQESARILEHLMFAGNMIPTENNGVLVFKDRGLQESQFIPIEEFGSFEFGKSGSLGLPFWTEDTFDVDLPKHVAVSFDDPDCLYDRGVRIASKLNSTNSTERKIDLPMTMRDIDASLAAQRALWALWGVRNQAEGVLPPSNIALNPGDMVRTIMTDGVSTWTEYIRMEKVSRGLNWEVQWRGRVEEPGISVQNVVASPRKCAPGSDPFNPSGDGTNISSMFITNHMVGVFNPGPFGLTDETNGLFAVWRKSDEPARNTWRAQVRILSPKQGDPGHVTTGIGDLTGGAGGSPGNGGTFWSTQGKVGKLSSSLPPAGSENGGLYWDRKGSLKIVVLDGNSWQPVTETEETVLSGANTVVVQEFDLLDSGSPEVLAFRDVSVESGTPGQGSPVVYRCSHLLRGLRGTQHNALLTKQVGSLIAYWPDFVKGHPFGSYGSPRFGYADRLTSLRFSLSDNFTNWLVLPEGTSNALGRINDGPRDLEAVQGANESWPGMTRPYPMADGRAIRLSDGNFMIGYTRSTRGYLPGLGLNAPLAPLSPIDSFDFVLDIFDNPKGPGVNGALPGDTVVRSISTSLLNLSTKDTPVGGRVFPQIDSVFNFRRSGFVVWEYSASQYAQDLYEAGDPIKCIAYQMRVSGSVRGWPSRRQLLPV